MKRMQHIQYLSIINPIAVSDLKELMEMVETRFELKGGRGEENPSYMTFTTLVG